MKAKYRRISAIAISVLLTLVMVLGMLPQAANAGASTYYIGVTSDVHDKITDLQTWLNSIHGITSTLDHMIFGGDYTYTSDPATQAAACSTAATNTFSGVDVVQAKGNHDTTGSYDSGLVYNGSDYAIYVFDLDASSQTISLDKINAADAALATVDSTKPVFVVSHYPLHYYTSRTTVNASALVDVLNQYPNVIFLWGHNHSLNDPWYGVVKKDGDTIQCASSLSPVTIHFTYANMGSIYAGTNNAYGLLISFTKDSGDTTVNFRYTNLSGTTTSEYSVTIDTASLAEKPAINTQPQDVTADVGEEALLSVDAEVTDGGTLSYQWYQNDTDTNTGGTLVGTDSNTFSAPTDVPGTSYYYCKVTNTKDGDTAWTSSETAMVKVNYGDAGLVYEYATSIESGCKYVIVDKSATDAYALTTEAVTVSSTDYLVCDPVTVTGDYIDPNDVDESMIWECTADGSGFNFMNGDEYLNRTSGTAGIYVSTTDGGSSYSDWEYSSSAHTLAVYSSSRSQYMYLYQTSSGSTYYFANSETASSTIYLYKLVVTNPISIDSVEITGIDAPVAEAVPDTSAEVATAGVISPAAVTWAPEDSAFDYDTVYTATVTLRPESIYAFSDTVTATVNGVDADSVTLNSNGTLTVTCSFAKTASEPQYIYQYATTIESGCRYVIVDKGSPNYALTTTAYSNYLTGAEVTVNGDYLDANGVTPGMIWTLTADGNGYNVKNGSYFLTRRSGSPSGITLNTTDAGASYTDWMYDSTNHYLRVYSSNASAYYYLYQTSNSSSNYYFTVSTTTYNTIYLYKQIAVVDAEAPHITGQPQDKTVTEGNTAELSVTADVDSGMLSYQWYSNAADSNTGGDEISGAMLSSYSAPTDTVGTMYYYCVVTNTDPSATGNQTASITSDTAKVTVLAIVDADTPQITAQPQDKTVNRGGTAMLSVTVSVNSGMLTYQWYSNDTDSSMGGDEIDGATLGYYYAPTNTVGTMYYYCMVTNTDILATGNQTATVASDAAKVEVLELTDAETPQITAQPQDKTVVENAPAVLSVTANVSTGLLSYQWYSNDTDSNTGGDEISGATLSSFSAPTDTVGTMYYYCVVTNTDTSATGNQTATAASDAAKVEVLELTDAETPQITAQPQDKTVVEDDPAVLSVTANVTTGLLSYQWYSNDTDSNTGGDEISGATLSSYSTPTDTVGTMYYYCVVTNTDTSATGSQTASVTSDAATVIVKSSAILSDVYTIDAANGVLSDVSIGTSAAELKSKLSNDAADIKIYDKDGNEYTGDAVATGMTVKLIIDGVVKDELKIAVLGDVSGDGAIDITDILYIRANIIGTYTMAAWETASADINGDAVLDVTDILYIRAHITGVYTIIAK